MATNVFIDGRLVPEYTYEIYRRDGTYVTISGATGLNCDIRGNGSLVFAQNATNLVVFAEDDWLSVNVYPLMPLAEVPQPKAAKKPAA